MAAVMGRSFLGADIAIVEVEGKYLYYISRPSNRDAIVISLEQGLCVKAIHVTLGELGMLANVERGSVQVACLCVPEDTS
jgi:hypothetical protein